MLAATLDLSLLSNNLASGAATVGFLARIIETWPAYASTVVTVNSTSTHALPRLRRKKSVAKVDHFYFICCLVLDLSRHLMVVGRAWKT